MPSLVSGQVLVESLVALSILTTGFLGMLTLLSRSIGLNRVVSDNYAATYLAGEGIEVVKNLLDADVLQGRTWADGVCSWTTSAFELDYATTLDMPPDSLPSRRLGGAEMVSGRPLLYDPNQLYQYAAGRQTPFYRTVRATCLTDEVVVNSVVNWTSRGGGTFTVNLEDHFLNWRP